LNDKRLDIDVKVQSRASRREIGAIESGRIKIRTTAAPIDGKANQDVARQLAEVFRVPPSRILLLKGATSRLKTFRVESPRFLPEWLHELDFS
jgi:uncharacterized protein (TIGR00251 family)